MLNHLDKTCEGIGARKLFKLIPPDKHVHIHEGTGKGKFYDRVRTVGKCKYIFDEKYAFEYNSNGKWVCCSCRFQYLQKNTLLDHLAKTCKGAQKLFKLIPPDKYVHVDVG
ncbi:unnamed protein product, partial [Allacma fusca]